MRAENGTFAQTITVTAVDQTFGVVLIRAGEGHDRKLLQLSYFNGTNTASVIPAIWLIAPDQTAQADGSYDLAAIVGYQVSAGPAAGHTETAQGLIYPTHAKANIQPIIIPAGWLLLAAPLDNDMDGTMIYRVISSWV